MKKTLKFIFIAFLLIILLSTVVFSDNDSNTKEIDYTESLETFDNPERGFYYPFYYNFKVSGNELPSGHDIYKLKILEDENLVHLRLGIGEFSGKVNGDKDLEFSEDMLNMLDTILTTIKNNGGTAIIRFAYDNFEGDEDLEPSLDMILKHIEQICPILSKNESVLAYVELGFFGPWGEMHTSKISTPENVAKALDVMLDNTPEELKIGVRQPKYYVGWLGLDRDKLNENITVKGTREYRVGLFNDGYLGSHSDLGTFQNREIEVQWLENQALHTLYGGEVVETRGSEENDKINTSSYMAEEAFRTHTTYLNSDYDEDVIDSWKNEIYNGSDELYKGQTGYLYIVNHLGYRFVLRDSDVSGKNDILNINLKIENVGFANLVNNKKVTIVLKSGEKIYELPVKIDPTTWNSNEIVDLSAILNLPKDIAEGNWDTYLRISEYGNLETDNNYQAIRLANNNIWDETLGANYIGSFEYTEKIDNTTNTNNTTTKPSNNTVKNEAAKPSNNTIKNETAEPSNNTVKNETNKNNVTNKINNNNTNKTNNTSKNNTITESSVKNENSNKIDNSVANSNLPKAGYSKSIISILLGLSILYMVHCYNKYEK